MVNDILYHSKVLSICINKNFRFRSPLKDKSRVGIIVDYSRDYTVVNGMVCSTYFQFFLLISETTYFNLLRSAK